MECENRGPEGTRGERASQPAKSLQKGVAKADYHKPHASRAKKNRTNDQDDASFHLDKQDFAISDAAFQARNGLGSGLRIRVLHGCRQARSSTVWPSTMPTEG